MSAIDPNTLRAYRDTYYHVLADPTFILRVGQANLDLFSAHERHKTDCSAFLTACNPYSTLLDQSSNAARQVTLASELSRRNLAFVPGIGKHPYNGWPGEESFLIFGLHLDLAKELGARWQQNGLIWSGADAVPQLILLC
jgi:hypothetical protein